MKVSALLVGALMPIASACATPSAMNDGDAPRPGRLPEGECNAAAAQEFIGQKATAELGALLLERSGARTLRWVPPRTAVTMDFSPSRLTVSYDDAYLIERISCG